MNGQGHIGQVNDIVFGKTGTVYSCSEDKTILSWSLLSGALVRYCNTLICADCESTVHTSKEAVNKICISHDSSVLAAAGSKIELIELSSSKVFKKLTGHTNVITSMKFSHDSSLLITSAKDRFIYLWNTNPNAKSTAALKGLTCFCATFMFRSIHLRKQPLVFGLCTNSEINHLSLFRSYRAWNCEYF